MSLSGLLTAVGEYVGDTLVNECGRPAPEVLRYHGTLPNDCCTDDGVLSVSWEREQAFLKFPASSAGAAEPCPGLPMVRLIVRYVVCWPVPDVLAESGTVLDYPGWDLRAATLADVADCVTRALIRLQCSPPDGPFADAVVAAAGRDRFRFVESTPILPGGGCAGVRWHADAGIASPSPGS